MEREQEQEQEPARCLAWARAVTAGAVRCQLRPTEVLLVLILQRETFLCGRLSCPVDLGAWGRELGLEFRKLRPHWEELIKLGVVDLDAGRGVCQVRPDASTWGKWRGERTTGLRDYGTTGRELDLRTERELMEARNQVSREAVLKDYGTTGLRDDRTGKEQEQEQEQDRGQGKREFLSTPARDYIAELRAAVEGGTEKGAAEKSAALPVFAGTAPAENSAGATLSKKASKTGEEEFSAGPIASLASVPLKAKLARAEEKSAGGDGTTGPRDYGTTDPDSERAWRWVQEVAQGRLHQGGRLADDWQRLCARDAGWVTGYLRRRLEKAEASGGVRDRLAYVAVVARKEGKFRR